MNRDSLKTLAAFLLAGLAVMFAQAPARAAAHRADPTWSQHSAHALAYSHEDASHEADCHEAAHAPAAAHDEGVEADHADEAVAAHADLHAAAHGDAEAVEHSDAAAEHDDDAATHAHEVAGMSHRAGRAELHLHVS